ncbi:MAG: hypothetical protein WBG01_05210 [Bacteroidota bacterium]
MKRMLIVPTIATFLFSSNLAAQYWGERVLEKSFERTEFFFTPSYLNPYGIGTFESVTPGLFKDPLLDFIVNPAWIRLDSLRWSYLYMDFRTARTVTEQPSWYHPPYLYGGQVAMDAMYYPQVYMNTRRELEPVFSGAVMGRPAQEIVPELIVGLTYQLVLQDDKYYSIPQDIYKTTAGYDYSGARAAAGESLPIVDKYSGKDNMSQTGHFLTGFSRYAFPIGLDMGAKLSRVTFSREGSFGSSNFWESSRSGSSLWSNFEDRAQEYSHWDVAGGIRYHLNPGFRIGAMLGYLWGDAVQELGREDSSYYSSTYSSGSSHYNRSGDTGQQWAHHGRTTYFGVDMSSKPTRATTLTLLYRHEQSTVDIASGSGILDTSYSQYSWMDNTGTVTSNSQSYLNDARSGVGTRDQRTERITGSLQWTINDQVRLSIGAIVEWQNTETRTTEAVQLASRSAYWSTSGKWDYRYSQYEAKDLDWTFSVERTSFQIPVFVTITASGVVEFLLGLHRDMAQWRITDVTLARFAYRVTSSNGVVERKENFAERYTMPTEQVTDVRTAFLAGLSLNVSQALNVRILMVPEFRDTYEGTELQDLQWWLGLSLTP